MERHYFLLRRLHSLSGILPIGVFLLFHLTTNSSLAWGALAMDADGNWLQRSAAYFQKEVYWIHGLPHLLILEITLWVSIAFHVVLGFYYAQTGKSNVKHYAYQDNWRYTLQRWSGYLGVLFIVYHVATLRWGWTWLVPGGTKWDHQYAASTLAAALQGSPEGFTFLGILVSLFYFAGVTLLVFHFANGLWTAAITWGITISEAAQRRWGYGCFAIGAALMVMGWSAIAAAVLMDPEEVREAEERLKRDTAATERTQPARPASADAEILFRPSGSARSIGTA